MTIEVDHKPMVKVDRVDPAPGPPAKRGLRTRTGAPGSQRAAARAGAPQELYMPDVVDLKMPRRTLSTFDVDLDIAALPRRRPRIAYEPVGAEDDE